MHRRFPFPNPRRFPLKGRRAVLVEQIRQAFTLFDSGDYSQAGAIFEELAHIAEGHNGPRYPRFYMQAGYCYLYANQPEKGQGLIEKGRQALIQAGRGEAAERICRRFTLETGQGVTSGGLQAPSPTSRQALPLKCPSCGAAVHPDEVTWLDESSAECDYCGSVLRG